MNLTRPAILASLLVFAASLLVFAASATAQDGTDFLFRGQFGVIESWYEADVPVEFHIYQNGGHGFGLGNPDRTSNRWFGAFIHWLDVNGFLASTSGD